ncbi:MAG: hypothetical protein ACI9R3_000366 [Verrucomicrobiales bacterium]|jgi:hypothetical protein
MKKHEWRERSADGEVQLFRATKHGGRWTLQTKLKGDEFWNRHDPLTREDVLIIQTMAERKYQRNRVPYEDLESLKKWLEQDEEKTQAAKTKKRRPRGKKKPSSDNA